METDKAIWPQSPKEVICERAHSKTLDTKSFPGPTNNKTIMEVRGGPVKIHLTHEALVLTQYDSLARNAGLWLKVYLKNLVI